MRVVGLKSSASLPELEQALTWKSRGKSRGGFKHFLFSIWDVILPIDELIFFKMVGIPPTRYDIVLLLSKATFESKRKWHLRVSAVAAF